MCQTPSIVSMHITQLNVYEYIFDFHCVENWAETPKSYATLLCKYKKESLFTI